MATGVNLAGLRKRDGEKIPKLVKIFKQRQPLIFLINSGEERVVDEIIAEGKGFKTTFKPSDKNLDADLKLSILDKNTTKLIFKSGRELLPVSKLANSTALGGGFTIGASTTGGGVNTETYSEILSMYCVAYEMKYNKSLTTEQFSENGDLVRNVWSSLSSSIKIPTSLWSIKKESDRRDLVSFGLSKLGIAKYTWLDCGVSQSKKILANVSAPNGSIVASDKLFGDGRLSYDPYKIYKDAGFTAKNDKWNPADMWIMTQKGAMSMARFNRKFGGPKASLPALNAFLLNRYEDKSIIPVSLKKVNPTSVHYVVMNSNDYVERIRIDDQKNPPIIEFTKGNRDVKINFILETVKLRKGLKAERIQTGLFSNIGEVVSGSTKEVKIKFKTSTRGLELEYQQTKGKKYAEAKQGALGKQEYNKIISQTSIEGIKALNSIKERYDDTSLKLDKSTSNFTSHDLKVDKDNLNIAKLYLDNIWEAINKDFSDLSYLGGGDAIKDKIIAGEIGISINNIKNENVKRRIIQNLYNACASVGIMSGLSPEERMIQKQTGLGSGNKLKADFIGSIHVKVY
jgi:hypothetical protein